METFTKEQFRLYTSLKDKEKKLEDLGGIAGDYFLAGIAGFVGGIFGLGTGASLYGFAMSIDKDYLSLTPEAVDVAITAFGIYLFVDKCKEIRYKKREFKKTKTEIEEIRKNPNYVNLDELLN